MYIAARNEERAKAAIEDLKQTTGNEAIWLKLDLASLRSIKAAAEEFLGCVHCIDFERTNDLIPPGKNQNSIFFSITRPFRSLAAMIELNLPFETVAFWGRRSTKSPLMGMT